MAYSAPELLLIGAARNLVLGNATTIDGNACAINVEDPEPPTSDLVELW